MYSWDNDFDYDKGIDTKDAYSFHDARKSYDDIAVAKTGSKVFYTYKSETLKTDSKYPIIIGIDTTGSMAEWPKVFFDKLPLLYKEAVKYLPDCEISFQAINDFYADGEDVALQPAPFGKGPELDQLIGQLYPYGGGGGQSTESYEMFAVFNSYIEAKKAIIKPICIILGDEAPFNQLPYPVARHFHLISEQETEGIPTIEVFKLLHNKCEVFLIRKPYYGLGKADKPIIDIWKKIALIPNERIINLNDPKRVVDAILGVLGIITGKTDMFETELSTRQTREQTTEVLESLRPLKKTYHKSKKTTQESITPDNTSIKTKGLDIDEE